jgi:hypothetical protein
VEAKARLDRVVSELERRKAWAEMWKIDALAVAKAGVAKQECFCGHKDPWDVAEIRHEAAEGADAIVSLLAARSAFQQDEFRFQATAVTTPFKDGGWASFAGGWLVRVGAEGDLVSVGPDRRR